MVIRVGSKVMQTEANRSVVMSSVAILSYPALTVFRQFSRAKNNNY